jgi:hypothetical protein
VTIFSCKTKEKDFSQNNDNYPLVSYSDELTDIDFSPIGIKIARFNDNDMERNILLINRGESNTNINETELYFNVDKILDKPFENVEISILSEYSQKRVFNGIEELLYIFNKRIAENIKENFNSNDLYKNVKITIENITFYVYREYNNNFKLYFVEYNNNYIYEPIIKIGCSKDDIINLLGNPSAYSIERDLFIYNSQETLRQINIYFERNIVKNIQLISWGGI